MYKGPASFEKEIIRKMYLESGHTGDEEFDEKIVKNWKKITPRPVDFVNIYSLKEIQNDIKRVVSIEGHFEEINKELKGGKKEKPIAIEYVLMEGIESGWLESENYDIYITPCSKYDDYINHTDFVINFHNFETGKDYYLGVDATLSQDANKIDQKIDYIIKDIKMKKLGQIKYYESEKTGEKKLLNLPRVLISIYSEKVPNLIDILKNRKEDEIKNNIVQYEIIEEIENQLFCYLKYILKKYLGLREQSRKLLDNITNSQSLIQSLEIYQANIDKNQEFKEIINTYKKLLEIIIDIKNQKKGGSEKARPSLNIPDELRKERLESKLSLSP